MDDLARQIGALSPAQPGDEGPAPLSFAQERLWFLDRLQPGVPVYNMPFLVPLGRACRAAAVEQALTEIVRRHDVLRTSFPAEGGRPVLAIAPSRPIALPIVDLGALPGNARARAIDRLLWEERDHVFDLARGPLLRARLLRAGEREHVLLVNMHHIVSDGWSLGVFVRELSALHDAFAAGRPSPLAELPLRYADHARAQRRRFTAAALDEHMAYWRAQLAGAPVVLELPLDRPRPPEQTFHGEIQPFTVPAEVAVALAALARRHGASLFMVLVAAWKALLHRYTGRPDVVVGTPIANRNRTELEHLIGLFVNTLVLRTQLTGELTFLELLARVREVTLGAYAHQDLPIEKLVE
jgi:non-ribosomal peptide synthetase component F